jgi:diguanylate cyclase (GGDEF)-like protein
MKGAAIFAILLFAFVTPALCKVETDQPAQTARLKIELPPPGRLPWVVFDEKSGLPQHTIVDLMTDQQGFVWAATQDGAARYDGRSWEPVALPREMGTNYPRAMRLSKDGGIWIGTFDGGLAYLHDNEWKIIDKKSGLPSNRIRGLLETTNAQGKTVLWIATDQGVARMENGKISTFGASSGLPSLDTEGLCEAVANGFHTLLVGTANGLARFENGRFVSVPVPKQILGNRIGDIVESRGLHGGPALWITSYGAGMGVLENGEWTILDTTSGLPSNVEVLTKSAAADGSPALWIGSEGGLLRFEHGRFTLFDERCGLPTRIVWKVLETTSPGGLKTLWLGTWGGGIERISPNFWTSFDKSMGMPSGSITSILVSKDNFGHERIFAGTSDGDLAVLEENHFQRIDLPESLRHTILFCLLETKDANGKNVLWVGSFGGGLGKFQDGHWSIYGSDVLPNQRIYTVIESKSSDGTSTLWIGTEGGLARFEKGKWTYFRQGAELPSDLVTQVLETRNADGTNTIWAGTSNGIAKFESGRWSIVRKGNGLLSENISSLQLITASDGTRWIWAGTFAGGVSRIRMDEISGKWETFTTSTHPALPSDTVQSVAQDLQHRIYVGTTRGIARLTPRTSTADDSSEFSVEIFTTEDGLPSGDCQQAARLVDELGRIWFGTARGLAMFDPRFEIPDRLPKPLVIETARLSNNQRKLNSGDSLSYAERNLSFDAALLAYGSESRIRYRYQLIGFDPQPSKWSARGSKEYTNLSAGNYSFNIWGRDARGNISGPAMIAFQIRPAPWLTIWAFGLYIFLLFAGVYGAMHWRVRLLSRRTKQLESAVAERTKELSAARDKLEQLASQDGLTQLANRRRFDSVLENEWKRAQRGGHWFSLALLDVDFFKRYNDHYGHAQGDTCLRAVAQATAAQCHRATDLVARYGGEEFVLILPETDPEGVRILLKSVLHAVDSLQIEHSKSTCATNVTVSLGAVSLKPTLASTSLSAIQMADQMLYKAKENGRHQAMHEDGNGPPQQINPS